jgi:predicted enzyme related to lactoylglutathione lyase
MQMSGNMPTHGTFCWNELMTRDVKAAGTFYSELIGWKMADSPMGDIEYTLLKAGEKEAGGMMAMPAEVPDQVPSHWMAYITVDDVDSLVEKIPALGGTILHGPQDVPGVGRFIIVQDPTGAAVGLITLASAEK